jgi:hypothetical protein
MSMPVCIPEKSSCAGINRKAAKSCIYMKLALRPVEVGRLESSASGT